MTPSGGINNCKAGPPRPRGTNTPLALLLFFHLSGQLVSLPALESWIQTGQGFGGYLCSGSLDFPLLTETLGHKATSRLLNDTCPVSSKVIEKSLKEGWLSAGLHWLPAAALTRELHML